MLSGTSVKKDNNRSHGFSRRHLRIVLNTSITYLPCLLFSIILLTNISNATSNKLFFRSRSRIRSSSPTTKLRREATTTSHTPVTKTFHDSANLCASSSPSYPSGTATAATTKQPYWESERFRKQMIRNHYQHHRQRNQTTTRTNKTHYPLRNGIQRRRNKYFRNIRGLMQLWWPSNDATTRFVVLNLGMFALQVWKPEVTQAGAKVSAAQMRTEPYRFLSAVFLHGGIMHLGFNTYSLMNMGPQVERVFGGYGRFTSTYLASGVAGNVLSAIQKPNPSVGASGAIFGLLGAYYVFLKRNEDFLGVAANRGLMGMRNVFMTNLISGLTTPNIDNWAHVGGAIGGAAMSYLIGPRYQVVSMGQGGPRFIVDRPIISLKRIHHDIFGHRRLTTSDPVQNW